MEQKIPDEGTAADGRLIKLFETKGDLVVQQYASASAEKPSVTTQYSHAPMAINRFRELTGQEPITYEKPKVTVNDGHEHDWEWVAPDDDESRDIRCTICGVEDIAEDEEE